MNPLKQLVTEIHRRSLWQVTGIFLAASWGVLQVVEVITETVGLPDWTPGMAFVLLLIGLPIVLGTAFVQAGGPGAERGGAGESTNGTAGESGTPAAATTSVPASAKRSGSLLTWRNAVLGGLGAFTLLGISLMAYFVMWETGIGPWGNLAAQGVFEDGEPIILAEFSNQSNDATLGSVVTEALRVDLASSQALTLVSSSFVDEILGLMQAGEDDALTADMALEVAERGGIKAVIDGEVGSAGSGYIISATIRATESGDPLATFRRTAKSSDDVIDAIDGLSQDIRERAGESLRSIKAEAPLDHVTTGSLEALRLYAEAEVLSDLGEAVRAKEMMLEALDLDPDFAMAWRKLAVLMQTAGGEPGEEQEAATRAFELSDRLTQRERGNAVAYYHRTVTGNLPAQIQAYEGLLANHPDDAPALNNLAIAYNDRTRHEDAIGLLERAIDGPGRSAPAFTNLVAYYAGVGRIEEARATTLRLLELYPERRQWPAWIEWWTDMMAGAPVDAHGHATDLINMPDIPELWRGVGVVLSHSGDAARGKLAESRRHQAEGIARHRAIGDLGGLEIIVVNAALIELYTTWDSARVRDLISDYIESDDFSAMPPGAHDWSTLAHALTLTGDQDGLVDIFARWSEALGPSAGTALSEARTAAEALQRADASSALSGLAAYRAQVGCPHCFEWQLAELSEAAGDAAGAAAAYEQVLAAPFSSTYNELPVARVQAHERLGRLYEELGEASQAAEHYAAFAEAWADADAVFQPRVQHAAERAAALAGSR